MSESDKLLTKRDKANNLIKLHIFDYIYFGKSTDNQFDLTVNDFNFFGVKYDTTPSYQPHHTVVDLTVVNLDNFTGENITIEIKYDSDYANVVLKSHGSKTKHTHSLDGSLVDEYDSELYFAEEDLIEEDYCGIFSNFMKEVTGVTTWISQKENRL